MKKLTKKIISLFAGIALAASFTLGIATLVVPTKASAAETPAIDNTLRVQMKEGAAVRISSNMPETGMGDQAIRFQTYVKKSYFDTLVNPETGVYVIPKDLLTGELTNKTPGAKRIVSQVYASETDTHYLYNSVLYDIPENSYGRDIVARAYVKSGSNYIWAANAQVRSLSYVASAALEDGKDANGEAFDTTEIAYLKNYVDKAMSSFAISEESYTMTVGETMTISPSVTPKYAEDNLSNLKVIYSSNNAGVATVKNGEIVAKSAGVATITATLGSKTDTFTVAVNSKNQDLLMTESAWSLDVSLPTGYSVTSITCGDANWGTNPASLTIDSALVADKTQHGEKTAIVNVSDGNSDYAIEIPVTLVTDTISSASEFSKVKITSSTQTINGYYVLTDDITSNSAIVASAGYSASEGELLDGTQGFCGTLDGRGYTVTTPGGMRGMFGTLGKSVIKNVTFTCTSINSNDWATTFLARLAVGATFENVNFTFQSITTGTRGLLFELGSRDCHFNNVQINITGQADNLFARHYNNWVGFNANQQTYKDTKCTFTNTTINLMTADSSLSMLGEGFIAAADWTTESPNNGTITQFIVDGCTTAASETTETVTGITMQSPKQISVTLENQDLLITDATHSLDLGVYANYTVDSIKFNGTDVGKDPTAITLPDDIVSNKAQHGTGKSFTVVVKSSTEVITLTIPVTLITAEIATDADFAMVQLTSSGGTVYGYYVLTANIVAENAATVYGADANGNVGFMGTLDGKGNKITYDMASKQNGLFGAIGNGVVIKDVTFEVPTAASGWRIALLGGSVVGATFDNVDFNFQMISMTWTEMNYGLLAGFSVANCTFKDVDFYLNDCAESQKKVGVLFAVDSNNSNSNDGFNAALKAPCTFTNCNIYLAKDVKLAQLGSTTSTGATQTIYVANGCTDNGTTVEGITISSISGRTETLDYTQDIYLTAKLQRIDLGEYADYEISSIKLGNYDFGTNPEKLTVSDAFKADKANHGEQKLIVNAQKGADKVELTVPVIFVTDTISTMSQLLALQTTQTHQRIYGYYILTSDIGALNTMVSDPDINNSGYYAAATCPNCGDSGCGFMGAIDGRGYTISLSIPSEINTGGLFRRIDKGAIFRNVTFDCGSIGTYWGTALMGRIVKDAIFENVTFNFRSIAVGNGGGLIAEKCTWNCDFTNVDFIINGTTTASLFGGLFEEGFSECTFTDCNVYLLNEAKLSELGHNNLNDTSTVYKTYDGITINDVEAREETLSYTQEVVLTSEKPSLNLGAYDDYEISSIKYGDYDLGTDINALEIPDALLEALSAHGEGKTIVVQASKYADIVSINVPVTLVTLEISTVNDFNAVQMQQNDVKQEIYGYYVLANDITSNNAIAAKGVDGEDHGRNGDWGFRGTLNGKGHTITTPTGQCGIFGVMGDGAVVKDITFTITSIDQTTGWAVSVLGRTVVGVTFENVVFNVSNIKTDNLKGLIGERTVRGCDFINVEFNIDGVVNQLFPTAISNWVGFNANQQNYPNTLCTFTNCTINLLNSDSSLGMLGAGYNGSENVTYQPTGVELGDGEQTVGGITLVDNTTGTYLLRNNASPYTIVVPATMTEELRYAQEELIHFFKEATGVELGTIKDTYLTHSTNGLYISLGATKAANTAGLSVPTLKRDGAYIKTQDKTIYILGGGDAGVINGVYELLGELFGYEQYYKDCYTLNTELKTIPLENFNITSNPDIDYRGSGGITYATGMKDGYVVTDNDKMYSYRIGSTDAYWKHIMPVINAADSTKAAADHNSLYYFPISMYQTSNPEFYSNNSTFDANSYGGINAQLCYTARGNSEGTYDLMTTLAAERIEESLIKYADNTTYTTVQIGMEDCYQTCTCSACNAIVSQYGALSATVIIFLNDVAVKVNTWMANNPQYARDLQYMFFAYNEFQKPPTTYPTLSDGVKIIPFVALSHMHHNKAITDTTTRNTEALGTISNNLLYGWMQEWGKFANQNGGKAWAWTYGGFMCDYFVFYDSYTFYPQLFKALKDFGYEMSIVQQHSGQRGADTAFFAMNIYLNNKLAWDSSLDINTLIDNYMAAMYLDAADAMKSLFTKWQSIYASKLSSLETSATNPASNLAKSDVDALFEILDDAYAAIAHYETSNPALYAKLKAHIDMEWLAPAKLAVTGSFAWRYKLSSTYKYSDIAAKFETLCNQFGIVALSEFDTIDATIEGL